MEYIKRYLYELDGVYYLFVNGLYKKDPIGFMVVKYNYPLKKQPMELRKTFKNIL